jgi:hypothetical protein
MGRSTNDQFAFGMGRGYQQSSSYPRPPRPKRIIKIVVPTIQLVRGLPLASTEETPIFHIRPYLSLAASPPFFLEEDVEADRGSSCSTARQLEVIPTRCTTLLDRDVWMCMAFSDIHTL